MSARTFIAVLLFGSPALAQEGVRDLTGAGTQSKYLTPNQLDRWLFDGEKGETLLVHVASKEFDPILLLAPGGAKDDKPFLEVDDPGSESRFAFRLPKTGKYEIHVHAFKFQGGGNYTLRVERFTPTPLELGKRAVGTFDRNGKGFHYLPGVKDRMLVPELTGTNSSAWRVLDHKGRDELKWGGTVTVAEDGELSVFVTGQPNQRYELLVREARRNELPVGEAKKSKLGQGEADVWSFTGKPGDFRVVEVTKQGELAVRLLHAPTDRAAAQRLARPGERPALRLLPVRSRGDQLRFAAVFGRDGRYQFQAVAESAGEYTIKVSDPSEPITSGKPTDATIPVGGSKFYRFQGVPGQLLQASLASSTFAPVLRLYDENGAYVAEGDGDDTARLTQMVVAGGVYRLQVSSAGDGGSGPFKLQLAEASVGQLKIGERSKGTLPPGGTAFRAFDGKAGQVVFLSARSTAFEPVVSVRGPNGVLVSGEAQGNPATGYLAAVKLPQTGRYTVGVSSRRGAGDFTLRVIDGD